MTISIEIDQETDVAIATCSGVLELEDAKAAASSLWETRGWTGRSVVWDLRLATIDFPTSEVLEIADFILRNEPTPPPTQVAFVTQRDIDYGVARMFEVFREDSATAFRVFRDFDEPMSWARPSESGAL